MRDDFGDSHITLLAQSGDVSETTLICQVNNKVGCLRESTWGTLLRTLLLELVRYSFCRKTFHGKDREDGWMDPSSTVELSGITWLFYFFGYSAKGR